MRALTPQIAQLISNNRLSDCATNNMPQYPNKRVENISDLPGSIARAPIQNQMPLQEVEFIVFGMNQSRGYTNSN
jgi:hypothetical protein